jgi:hypothetical protein
VFVYPKPALLGRIVPKAKIYQFASANAATKELFVNQVDSIVWQYKLAPETIHLPATDFVTEIQIFDIHLKMKEFDNTVLDCIDKGIAFPLIFQCHFENQTKIMACYKRPSESDSEKWVTSEYFSTPWFDKHYHGMGGNQICLQETKDDRHPIPTQKRYPPYCTDQNRWAKSCVQERLRQRCRSTYRRYPCNPLCPF